jgi:citrate synthase
VIAALNAALVLLADHELAASTLAAGWRRRRADPYAVVGAALGAVSGPLHGGASRAARLMIEAAATVGPEAALADALVSYGAYPGFGQRLYPEGDPRAVALLPYVRAIEGRTATVRVLDAVAEVARARVGVHPNIDFALAGLSHVSGLPMEAGEIVFAVARTAGWIAHAIEEYGEARLRFRPRAVYVGPRR